MHADSTMAVEVAISEALLNWPYFQDLSLVGVGGGRMGFVFNVVQHPAAPATLWLGAGGGYRS